MRMTTCDNGHYYDNQKNASCPYCNTSVVNGIAKVIEGSQPGQTKIIEDSKPGKTKIIGIEEAISPTELISEENVTLDNGNTSDSEESNKTIYITQGAENVIDEQQSIVDSIHLSGWLVIISKNGRGNSFPIAFGRNNIGRGSASKIHIENGDKSISREEHAVIIYDYKNNKFFAKHEKGQYLSYLNGELLLEMKELKSNDKLTIGNTELIFIPLCTNRFAWEN